MTDADTIIHLHQMALWDAFVEIYEVAVPATIVGEVQFFYDEEHARHPIDLRSQIAAGRIEELNALADDLLTLSGLLSGDLQEGLHHGEQEALALIYCRRYEGRFCTSDKLAIQTLAAIGYGERGISLEEALRLAGYSLKKRERERLHLTTAYFQEHIREGQSRRLQGRGVEEIRR